MGQPFKGTINIDIKDSQPDWGPYTQPLAPDGAPNVLYVVLDGGGLVVGHSGAEPVADDYPGEAPWPFVGGTITRVLVDVSGEAFVDLAQEARAAFAHQ